jgi:hypothetical protein
MMKFAFQRAEKKKAKTPFNQNMETAGKEWVPA